MSVRGVLVDPRAVDLGNQDVAVGERGIAVGIGDGRAGYVGVSTIADLAGHLLLLREEQDPVVGGVGHRDRAVLQQVGVVGLVQISRRRAGLARVPVLPQDRTRGVADLHDGVVVLLVGDDPRAVV